MYGTYDVEIDGKPYKIHTYDSMVDYMTETDFFYKSENFTINIEFEGSIYIHDFKPYDTHIFNPYPNKLNINDENYFIINFDKNEFFNVAINEKALLESVYIILRWDINNRIYVTHENMFFESIEDANNYLRYEITLLDCIHLDTNTYKFISNKNGTFNILNNDNFILENISFCPFCGLPLKYIYEIEE